MRSNDERRLSIPPRSIWADGSPRIDLLGGITTGYGNLPYKGQTLVAHFIYKLAPAARLFLKR